MTRSRMHVKWDSYQQNVVKGFSYLQQREEFVDMTIAAASHVVKVHKNLLALASPYFKEMIQSIPCKHPVIFLSNIDSETLEYLLEYIYTGEVMIPCDKIVTFSKACSDLHIIGVPPPPTFYFTKTATVNQNPAHGENYRSSEVIDITDSNTSLHQNVSIENVIQVQHNSVQTGHPPIDQPAQMQSQQGNTFQKPSLILNPLYLNKYPKNSKNNLNKENNSILRKNRIQLSGVGDRNIEGSDFELQNVDLSNTQNIDMANTASHSNIVNSETNTQAVSCNPDRNISFVIQNIAGNKIVENESQTNSASDAIKHFVIRNVTGNETVQNKIHNNLASDIITTNDVSNTNIVNSKTPNFAATENNDLDYITSFDLENFTSATKDGKVSDFSIHSSDLSDDPENMDVDNENEAVEYCNVINEQQNAKAVTTNTTHNPKDWTMVSKNLEDDINVENEDVDYCNVINEQQNAKALTTNTTHNPGDSTMFPKNPEAENNSNYTINIELSDGQPKLSIVKGPTDNKDISLNNLLKTSLQDSTPIYTVSNKHRLQMILNRFMYGIHHVAAVKRTWRWRCIDYRHKHCPAYIDTQEDEIVARKFHHNHSFHDKKVVDKGAYKSVFMFTSLKELADVIDRRIADLPYVDLSKISESCSHCETDRDD